MNSYDVTVNGATHRVQLVARDRGSMTLAIDGTTYTVSVASCAQHLSSSSHQDTIASAPARPRVVADRGAGAAGIVAPMPGLVVNVLVKTGDVVTPGQTVAVIEAMKMENNIAAPRAGTVTEVLVAKGKEVEGGALLIRLGS